MARKAKDQQKTTPKSDFTKQEAVLRLLRRTEGASIEEICAATSWKAPSARAFLSAVVAKRLGVPLISEKNSDGERRYHIAALKPSE